MTIKQELCKACHSTLNERLTRLQTIISGIELSLNTETKSTAGDKHETGRATLQLEREKLGVQLQELERQRAVLGRIHPKTVHDRPALGSIIYTTTANYFMAVGIGELKIKDQTYYVLSFNSPIGQLLKGKCEGESFYFKDKTVKFIKII